MTNQIEQQSVTRRTVYSIHMPPTEDIQRLAEVLFKGGLTPKRVDRPEHLAVRIIAGLEIGLSPVQAVNNIMVINGRASLWGDAALAIVRASGLLVFHDEEIEGTGEDRLGYCTVQRDGEADKRKFTFSVADAIKAQLWTKDGPWQTYPDRMLKLRARAFALRDVFPDLLSGLAIVEEQLDAKPEKEMPPTSVESERKPELQHQTDQPITQEILEQIAYARPAWIRGQGIDPHDDEAVGSVWTYELSKFGVSSASKLSLGQSKILLDRLLKSGHEQEKKEVFGEAAAAA